MFEEVGVAIDLLGEPAVVVDADPQRIDIVYRARLSPGQQPTDAVPCSPEIVETKWFARAELPELQHETAQALVALSRAATQGATPAD